MPDGALIESLKHVVTKVGLDNVFIRRGDAGRLAPLAEVIKRCVGEVRWERNPNRCTNTTIRKAINTKLPEKLSGRNPDAPKSKAEGALYGGKPEREIAFLMCGYGQYDAYSAYPNTYDGRFRDAAIAHADLRGKNGQQLSRANGTVKRMTTVIWQDLAQALLDLAEDAEKRREKDAQTAEEHAYVVDRLKIRRALEDAINHGDSAITWVDGPLGSGKTTLVQSFVRRTGELTGQVRSMGEPVLWIDCATVTSPYGVMTIHGRIAQVLSEHDIPVPGGDEALRRRFVAWLCEPSAPAYVVVANHEAGTFPELAQPHAFESHVIVVSKFSPPNGIEVNRVRIGDLKDAEAAALIRHYIPDATNVDCSKLAEGLFRRVRFLHQACRAMHSMGHTIDSYLKLIETSRAFIRALNVTATDDAVDVGAHFRLVLKALAHRPNSLRLLFLILSLLEETSIDVVKIFWSGIYGENAIDPTDLKNAKMELDCKCANIGDVSKIDHGEVDRAIVDLKRVGLIEVVADAISCDSLTRVVIGQYYNADLVLSSRRVMIVIDRVSRLRLDYPQMTDLATHEESRKLVIAASSAMDRACFQSFGGSDLPGSVRATSNTLTWLFNALDNYNVIMFDSTDSQPGDS